MTYDLKRFHNNLPHLPSLQDVETKEILKLCVTARASLAGLKQVGEFYCPPTPYFLNLVSRQQNTGFGVINP